MSESDALLLIELEESVKGAMEDNTKGMLRTGRTPTHILTDALIQKRRTPRHSMLKTPQLASEVRNIILHTCISITDKYSLFAAVIIIIVTETII